MQKAKIFMKYHLNCPNISKEISDHIVDLIDYLFPNCPKKYFLKIKMSNDML